MKYLEIKRHLDKPDESYTCELLMQGTNYVVLKYVNDSFGQIGKEIFESGSTTFAYYRTGVGYVLWKMFGVDGKLKGHLFHICKDLWVGCGGVEYLDLFIDLWFDLKGGVTVLDREDLKAFQKLGGIEEDDLRWIHLHEQKITRNATEIIGKFDTLLSQRKKN